MKTLSEFQQYFEIF